MRGWIVVVSLTIGVGCSLAEELQGAACRTEGHCDKSQSCVLTEHQRARGDGVGTCSDQGACVPGEQPGCECVDRGCTNAELTIVEHPEQKDNSNAPLCFCCPSECSVDQHSVITEIGNDGSVQCMCCDTCGSGMMEEIVEDDDRSIDECGCVPISTTDSDSSGSN
jgi:hypothetical protein